MGLVRFIGDVHGKWDRYEDLVVGCESTVQVGDFGVGFRKGHGGFSAPPERIQLDNHRFIRGNHDNVEVCQTIPGFIFDGTVDNFDDISVMYVGGAYSIDFPYRTEGVDWWRTEENSYQDLMGFLDTYESVKPNIMITHDCPFGNCLGVFSLF